MLKEIIKSNTEHTNGKVVYKEQFVKIISSSLDVTKDEARLLMKNIAKKKENSYELIVSKLTEKHKNEEDEIKNIFEFFDKLVGYEFYSNFEIAANGYIDAIRDKDCGRISYDCLMLLIIKLFDDSLLYEKSEDIRKEKLISLLDEKYKNILPNLYKRVIGLIS